MPVHAAGPRLYHSVKFKHLVHKAGSAGGGPRASNVSLNLTPFVDMMTILVCFLLMVFSAGGQLLQAQHGLQLPIADSREALQQAPVIMVSKNEITYINGNRGELVATVESVMRDDNPTFKIDALYERMEATAKKIKENVNGVGTSRLPKDLQKACEDAKQNIRPTPGHICPDGLAILQADEGTDARLINKIVNTAKIAGFDNLLFAVKNK
jgi:biopolymer transport protein ExbD